jgi:hypothetical protein
MATAVAVGTMKMAQVSKPGAGFQIVEREIPEPGAGEVRIKVQACGVCHSDALTKAIGLAFNIHAFPVTKSQASSMKWALVFPRGRKGSESVSAGTAVMTARAASACVEIFAIAGIKKLRASAMTADISNTWWLP